MLDLVVIPQILVIDVQKSQSPTFYCEKGRRQQDPNFESIMVSSLHGFLPFI